MSENINVVNNSIYNLPTPTGNAQPATKGYADINFLKLSGGNMTGNITVPSPPTVYNEIVLSFINMIYFFVEKRNPYVNTRFNMVNHKIRNLVDPTDATDGVNLRTLNKYIPNDLITPTDLHI